MTLPPLDREVDISRFVVNLIRERLPPGWTVELDQEGAVGLGRRADAVVKLISAAGEAVSLIAEVKRTVVTRDLENMLSQLRAYAEDAAEPDLVPLLITRYLPPPAQGWLTDRNVAYADATGNIRLALERPALFLRDVGATKDPWRGAGRPRGTLLGEPPARVVRALVDYPPPMSVPRLVKLSGASTGATYRVVQFLQEQALLDRAPDGLIENAQWRPILERWAKDYGFLRSNTVTKYLQPRGIPTLMNDLARLQGVRYALTGSLAAANWAPYAPARSAMLYADNPGELAAQLGLREVDTGPNVLIAAAAFDVVFERSEQLGGVTVVAPSQAAVDLLTGPGRNPAEAQALLDWMENDVTKWRR